MKKKVSSFFRSKTKFFRTGSIILILIIAFCFLSIVSYCRKEIIQFKQNEKTLNDRIKELTNENYSKFRNETKTRSKSEHYHKAILEVKKRTNELNKLLEYAIRLKEELNQVDEIKSSRHTLNALDKVTENIKEVYIKAKKLK